MVLITVYFFLLSLYLHCWQDIFDASLYITITSRLEYKYKQIQYNTFVCDCTRGTPVTMAINELIKRLNVPEPFSFYVCVSADTYTYISHYQLSALTN